MTYSSEDTPRPALNATRARQGRWGRHMFWVLLFGTLLAALGLMAAWFWKAPALTASETPVAERAASAAAFDAPEPVAPTPPSQ